MARNQTRRIAPDIIEDDEDAFSGLKTITNYAPANPAYTVTNIQAAKDEMDAARVAEAQADAAFKTARDNLVKATEKFHDGMQGAKDQVTAQFGRNSDEVQRLNRKKTSDYKPRARKGSKG
jgi:hypothetical protein